MLLIIKELDVDLDDIICETCDRNLPNLTFLHGDKCKWCDGEYHE